MLLISTSLYLFLAPLSGSQGYVGLDGAGNFPRHTLAILLLFLLSFLVKTKAKETVYKIDARFAKV
jgi:hypothetical protein